MYDKVLETTTIEQRLRISSFFGQNPMFPVHFRALIYLYQRGVEESWPWPTNRNKHNNNNTCFIHPGVE
jgi:hypothetical protein